MLSSSHRGQAPRDSARSLSRPRRRSGLTLIEAVVALVVLGLAGVAALEGAAQAMRTERAGESHLLGVSLADTRLSALVASPIDSLLHNDPTDEGIIDTPFGPYRWRTTLQPRGSSRSLIDAAVSVEWNDGAYRLVTTLYRPDGELRRTATRSLVASVGGK